MIFWLVVVHAVSTAGMLLLLYGGRRIMATLKELKDAIAAVQTGVDGLETAISGLKDQLTAGSPVTQADLDELLISVQAISADIADPADQGA